MADQAPRSITNMVFILLLALAFAGFLLGAFDMVRDAMLGPG
jgi:hypothetical protein